MAKEKERRLLHAEKYRATQKRSRDRRPDEMRMKLKLDARKWRAENPRHYLLYAAKQRAKKFSIPFSITPDDIVIPDVCPVLGIPLIRSNGKGPTDTSPSIDRIVPSLGYIPGNICVISVRANTIKSNATLEELLAVAEYVRRAKRSG